jgi:CubicO group peptidase (beta-lactamase class C family)
MTSIDSLRRLLLLSVIMLASLVLAPAGQSAASKAAADKVDAVFAKFTRSTPGCALGVVQDGSVVYRKGYGLASQELGVPISPETVFDIGSDSKQITAAAVILLAQQGKLSLNDDVRKFLPEFPDYGKTIRISNLLHHTSGIRDYIGLLTMAGAQEESVTTDDEALGILAKQKGLNFAPGDDFLYSNSNYFLLSIIVKRASGKTLREFAAENIFAPLGMNNTQILDDHQRIVPNKASSYFGRDGKYHLEVANWEQTGDGAVNTTIGDLAKWDANFYSGKVGGGAMLRELQTPGVLNDGTKLTYADGLVVDEDRGLQRVSHGGAWAGFRTYIERFPERRFSVIVSCNLANSNPAQLADEVVDLYLGSRVTAPPALEQPKSNEDVSRYVGTYWSVDSFAVLQIGLRDGKLWTSGPGLVAPLISQGNGTFSMSTGGRLSRLRFQQVEGGVMQMIATPKGAATITLDRVAESKPPDLAALAGDYVSEELNGVRVSLKQKDGSLVLRWPADALRFRFDEIPLTAFTADVFAGQGKLLKFQDNGFVLAEGRERGMKFLKMK